VGFITELLIADHLPEPAKKDPRFRNELHVVAEQLQINVVNRCSRRSTGPEGRNFDLHPNSRPIETEADPRRSKKKEDDEELQEVRKKLPYSSRSFQVDHDRCILCDRCARSCSEVKPFKVIGHTGKGYNARVSFDLDQVMNESSCVQCGECMTACPTGAITLNRRVVPKPLFDYFETEDANHRELKKLRNPLAPLPEGFLTVDQMREVVLDYNRNGQRVAFYPFRDIPYAYLKWNEGAVRRRRLKDKEVFINEGEFGTTAFLLERGKFRGQQTKQDESGDTETPKGFLSFLRRVASKKKGGFVDGFPLSAENDLILGEIACLTNSKRTATVWADGEAVVLEMTRNMVEMLQRSPAARDQLNDVYKRRAMRACLIDSDLFKGLSSRARKIIVAAFQKDAEVRRLEPGQLIVKEGTRIGYNDKGEFLGDFYVIFQGFVKVSQTRDGLEHVLNRVGPNKHFGEIALLPDHPKVKEICEELKVDPGRRTATVTALSDVEIVRVPGATFRKFFGAGNAAEMRKNVGEYMKLAWLPAPTSELEARQIADEAAAEYTRIVDSIADVAVKVLRSNQNPPPIESDRMGEFVRQGLYQGQKMLVLDLLTCTRCDECTKACADAHGDGNSRLLREGLRFGDFLVAASCRSCHQPYCMEGCPVDAIHRNKDSLEILIENHCIGCSLCEQSCPYGSIQMVPHPDPYPRTRWTDLLPDVETTGPTKMAQYRRKAVNCDLCHDLVGPGNDPFCVSACPHKAAFRWSGDELLREVKARG
jgi:Fe-S-cluster-containing hydrogenase component 2/CRP-like cAMP-binding protein